MRSTQYLRAFARFWWLIVLCVAIGIPIGAGVSTSPSVYTSSSSVLVSPTPLGGTSSSEKYATIQLAQQRMFTYEGLADGPGLIDKVRTDLHARMTADELQQAIAITVPDNSTVLNIVVRNSDRSRAKEIATDTAEELAGIINNLENVRGAQNALLHARVTTRAGTTTTVAPPPAWRNPLLGAIAGLLVAMGLAVLAFRVDPRVDDEQDVADALEAPVLGVLPSKAARGAFEARGSGHAYEAAVRELRTSIFFLRPGGEPGRGSCLTLTLTSPHVIGQVAQLAVDVATTLADTGARVLLVDANLQSSRPGALDDETGDEARGLAGYLNGACTEDEVVWRDPTSGVDMVLPGVAGGNTADLLHAHRFATLLEHAAQRYDFVLAPTPATTTGTDAAAVAARSDGAIVVVVRGRTRRAELHATRAHLERVEARVLGAVLLT